MSDETSILAPRSGSTAVAYGSFQNDAVNPAPWWVSAGWLVVMACTFSYLLVSLLQLG